MKGECAASPCWFQDEIVGEIRGAGFKSGKCQARCWLVFQVYTVKGNQPTESAAAMVARSNS